MPSKRTRENSEQLAKKKRSDDGPAQLDISLQVEDGEPTASDYYQAAIEERQKVALTEQDIDPETHSSIITSLFEKAIEKFSKQMEENENDERLREKYANCCFDLAKFVNILEYFRAAHKNYEIVCKNSKESLVHFRFAQSCFKIAELLFDESTEQSDDNEVNETKEQLSLVSQGVTSFRTALQNSTEESTEICEIAALSLLEYALAQQDVGVGIF